MRRVRERKRVEPAPTYSLFFQMREHPGSGLAFPCTREGMLLESDRISEQGRENRRRCLAGDSDLLPGEVIEETYRPYWEDAVGLCEECGDEVTLSRFTNTCGGCRADYDRGGHRLAPREQWGEETGECYADILQADIDPWGGDR